jgi:hypothetical protein
MCIVLVWWDLVGFGFVCSGRGTMAVFVQSLVFVIHSSIHAWINTHDP